MRSPTRLLGLLGILGVLSTAGPVSLLAAEPDPFPGLKSHEIKGYLTVSLHYDPQITQFIDKRLTTEDEPLVVRVFRTKLDRTRDEWYFVDYDEGPSADPEFIVTKEGAKEPAGSVNGLHLYLPGNGSLYVSGHADTMFDEHRKYVLKAGKLEETKQPYLSVGLTGPAKKDLTIYSTTAMKEAVAAIPKGTAMTVVLSDGHDNYLVKTAFGLLGWVKIPGDSQEATVIDGLFFAGD